MPHIFRFHEGRNMNIYDWKSSDKITSAEVRDINDKTTVMSSSAGTSIPTPIARMFLFKTAFDIISAKFSGENRNNEDESLVQKSIYSGLVSETLDLLELLYLNGADESKFRYHRWVFENNGDYDKFFGDKPGNKLLAESFRQAANQSPFNGRIEIIFIYYMDKGKEVLLGGTSPFTFVFTSPNFKRKMKERGFSQINGLVSDDYLFDNDYKQLHQRDSSFIKYIESLIETQGINESFKGFIDYVTKSKNKYFNQFNGSLASLQNIQFDNIQLASSGVFISQISKAFGKERINQESDFKLELPADSNYKDQLNPLFLLDKMNFEGQYTSSSSNWSFNTRISEIEYPETNIDDIKNRELPGVDHIHYPFLTSFDFFERCLVKLPGYSLNDERFITLSNNQTFLCPIKPIFFHFFPINKLNDYLTVEEKDSQITFTLKLRIWGPTKGARDISFKQTYSESTIVNYSGILGIYPFTKSTEINLLHTNKYTVASYEKTNSNELVESVRFYKFDKINKNGFTLVPASPVERSNYSDINTKTTYYQLNESFDLIQLKFQKDNSSFGGVIIPKFKEVVNGTEEYTYAIDFGTSNTHIEYGKIINGKVSETNPFTIDEKSMQMFLLNKPREQVLHDGAEIFNDYERSLGHVIDAARKVTLREFIPFQIGNQKSSSVKFPFRTATCESNSFISNHSNNRLFLDANIGFHIDDDALLDNIRYKTDLKWLLEHAQSDQFNKNRVLIFFKELLLMIRTKVLIEDQNNRGDITKLKIAMSFPISMGDNLKNSLKNLFDIAKEEILGKASLPIEEVTESIAPYYHLKSENQYIQNDSYCNIDIGGGTTDIVVIVKNESNMNEMNCYCSSFKFAGKQLWSSGANEFNSLENGFVSYYKQFIEKIDPNMYQELQRVLNSSSTRTEDIVGLLFSKLDYKFAEIFTDLPNLKSVLLIHYASILYYITKIAELKNIEPLRTISFSGKGSEYLNILFPNDNDLKGFTNMALGIFSGNPTNSNFEIKRTNDPKVITAKGSVRYVNEKVSHDNNDWGVNQTSNSNEKKLITVNSNFKGFKDLSLESNSMNYADLLNNSSFYENIMKSQIDFFNLLFDNKQLVEIVNKKLQINDFAMYKSFFITENGGNINEGRLRDSFKATIANLNSNDKVTDSPFFFALNYSLIELTREIANSPK